MKNDYATKLELAFRNFNQNYAMKSRKDAFGLLANARDEFVHYAMTLEYMKKRLKAFGSRKGRCLDAGGHVGILSTLFSNMGYEAINVDNMSNFDKALFDNALSFMEDHKVAFLNVDLMSPELSIPIDSETIDVVVFQAVIEHLPHSPRLILDEFFRILKRDGSLVICTPNGGNVGSRLTLFRKGDWPYWNLKTFYESKIPFLGHHRLYSINDLDSMAQWSGFARDNANTIFFDHGTKTKGTFLWKAFWYGCYRPVIYRFLPKWRAGIWAVYNKCL